MCYVCGDAFPLNQNYCKRFERNVTYNKNALSELKISRITW